MWFRRHKGVTASLIVLLFPGILFAVSLLSGQGASGFKGTLQTTVHLVGKPLQAIGAGVRDGLGGLVRFRSIQRDNKALKAALQAKDQELGRLALQREELAELRELRKVFHEESLQREILQGANIIAVDYSTWVRVFTIDRGRNAGIKAGDAVLVGNGLVGKVLETASGTAKVLSLLDDQNKISFLVEGNRNMMGIVQGDGGSGLTGYLLEGGGQVKAGDILRTSGIGNYPKGLRIGTVQQVNQKKGATFLRIAVSPAVNLHEIRKVAVIL